MPSYRRTKRIPTELTWADKYPRDYLFRPSKAFARIEKMERSWRSQVKAPTEVVSGTSITKRSIVRGSKRRSVIGKGVLVRHGRTFVNKKRSKYQKRLVKAQPLFP